MKRRWWRTLFVVSLSMLLVTALTVLGEDKPASSAFEPSSRSEPASNYRSISPRIPSAVSSDSPKSGTTEQAKGRRFSTLNALPNFRRTDSVFQLGKQEYSTPGGVEPAADSAPGFNPLWHHLPVAAYLGCDGRQVFLLEKWKGMCFVTICCEKHIMHLGANTPHEDQEYWHYFSYKGLPHNIHYHWKIAKCPDECCRFRIYYRRPDHHHWTLLTHAYREKL